MAIGEDECEYEPLPRDPDMMQRLTARAADYPSMPQFTAAAEYDTVATLFTSNENIVICRTSGLSLVCPYELSVSGDPGTQEACQTAVTYFIDQVLGGRQEVLDRRDWIRAEPGVSYRLHEGVERDEAPVWRTLRAQVGPFTGLIIEASFAGADQ